MEVINKHKRIIIGAIILFCSLFFFYVKISQSPSSLFCIDEYSWLSRTYYFDLLLKGDLSNRLWDVSGMDPDPKLTTYLYGALIYPKYVSFAPKKNETNMISYLINNNYFNFFINKNSYRFFRQKTTSDINIFDIRILNINYKPINLLVLKYGGEFKKILELLFYTRIFASFFTTLGVLIYFLLLIKISKRPFTSLLLAFAYGLSKVVYSAGTLAMTEPFYIFFTMICIYLLINIVENAKSYKNILLFAIFASFATQVKLSGCVFIIIYIFFQCLFIIKNTLNHKSIRQHVIFLMIVPIISISIYYISDPSLYKQPIKSTALQYTKTLEMGSISVRKYPKGNITSLKKKLIYVYQFVQKRNVIIPITYEEFSFWIFIFYIYGAIIGARKALLDIYYFFSEERRSLSNETVFFISFNLLLTSMLLVTPLAADRYMVTFIGIIQYSIYLGISDLVRRVKWIYNSLFFP